MAVLLGVMLLVAGVRVSSAHVTEIRPQPGPQELFLSTPADIAIFGGAAGGGKSWGLLMDPLRYVHVPRFGAVTFRRTYPEITQEGGIWDESQDLYRSQGAKANEASHKWTFPSGATCSFHHLQHEKTKYNYKSSQIAHLSFDELTSFTRSQFFYLLSRNRSSSRVPACVRCGTNPEPGWVADLISWWIHRDDGDARYGFPIEERAARVRCFFRDDDVFYWGDTRAEVYEQAEHLIPSQIAPEHAIKSLTFIPATVYDNKILLERDPGYLANLLAQNKTERGRLLEGNWLIEPEAGDYFDRGDIEIISPMDVPSAWDVRPSRHWDLAGTKPSSANPDPDYTAGSKFAAKGGVAFWLDCRLTRNTPGRVEDLVRNTASQDGRRVQIWIEQEPGQSGKSQVEHYARNVLRGYTVRGHRPTGDKQTRAQAPSAASERGEIKMVAGDWNKQVLQMLERFPSEKEHDDPIDTLSQFWDARMVKSGTDWGEMQGMHADVN